ncbi:MAG: SWIM zinc finger family protein [Desulfosarcina sp.]|nr:SWIM zinc finger family protein [Desulfosarcina sp.]MBC2741799.1 SWIM zinc finger family protein [Desulfosarcina sp.]MBC2764713.1 helicase [Desulfosarcina sp.]
MNDVKATANVTTEDPFFFDQERLQAIAGKTIVSHGLEDHRENRVMEIDRDQDLLWGRVEGADPEIPNNVTIRLTGNGFSFACDCDDDNRNGACRHVVAVLFRYADQCGETDKLLTATDSAIKDRIKRGRSEVIVESLSGEPWFGSWRASSLGGGSHFSRSYRVTIRSLRQRANFCSCPDFANNQLGTCKHIEAVLHKVQKHPQYEQFKIQPAPFPYVYLAWEVEDAPQLKLYKTADMPHDLQDILDRFFNSSGEFKGRLPDDFFHFTELVDARGDVHLGEDAVDYARQLATAAAHRQRSVEIKSRIKANNRMPGVKARLYPYQVEGVAFLAGTGRALLADDMGLGKTLQAISAAAWLREYEGVRKTLIICPASLKQQWAREIAKFTDHDAQVIQGPPPQRGVQYRRECGFFILNYELLLRDRSLINEIVRPDLIILDEAQRIKNWRTKIASAVKLIPSRYAFVLTGTPLENRLEDLYSLMQVVEAKILGPLWRYMIDFHVTDQRGKVLGYRNLSVLRRRLAPVMLRRDRRVVSDQLPGRIVTRLDVEMTAKQVELHDTAMSAAGRLATIAKRRPLTPTEQNRLMAALQQARMACDAAGLVDKESEGSPKIDELSDILEEVCQQSGLKVVVFSQWEKMTRMVETRLRRMGIGFVRLHGGVPTAKRGPLMDSFREDDSIQVFLSTDAGGVGLNLQSGSVVVNLDVPWNPAVLEQRNARVHRLGQTRTVQVITMVAADSYEEHVLSLVQGKQDLFDNVIAEDADRDVVGVSKKLLETLVDDLADDTTQSAGEKLADRDEATEDVQDDGVETVGDRATGVDDGVEREITLCIEELQAAFGARIERILGSGGGLLAVLDRVGAEEDRMATALSERVPVAVIDQRTLAGLDRLGAGSPVAESRTYYDAAQQGDEQALPRLLIMATEKVKAATVLIEQQCFSGATELLMSAMLAAAAERAGLETPVMVQDAGVWLYGDALPKGLLNQEEAALMMRAVSLAQSPSVPEPLLAELSMDVESFVTQG